MFEFVTISDQMWKSLMCFDYIFIIINILGFLHTSIHTYVH